MPRAEVSTVYAPFLLKFFPGVLGGDVSEKFVFPGMPRSQVQFAAPRRVVGFGQSEVVASETEEDFVIEEFD
jgi:hypothetical protein